MKNFFENEASGNYAKETYDKPEVNDSGTDATTIFNGMRLTGKVEGKHNFYLNGELDGKVNINELFKVGKTGKFKGEVKAKIVLVEGDFEGKVTADEKVEILDSGHYKGDIITPSVLISDKAFFQGNVTMTRKGQDDLQDDTTITVVESDDDLVEEENQVQEEDLA